MEPATEPPTSWAPDAPSVTTPTAEPEPTPAAQRFLSVGWRWVLVSGWATLMACLGLVANTGWVLGGEPFWLSTYVLAFLAPAAVLLAAAVDSRRTLQLSWLAVGVTAVIGVVDLFVAPAMGIAELVLAGLGALLTLAASSGRVAGDVVVASTGP